MDSGKFQIVSERYQSLSGKCQMMPVASDIKGSRDQEISQDFFRTLSGLSQHVVMLLRSS